MLTRLQRRDTPVEKLKKSELQEEVRELRGDVKRDETRIENRRDGRNSSTTQ